jgi:regulator of cell morphogenesis and NO signaling
VDPLELSTALSQARELTERSDEDYNQWSLDRLCRHIEQVHHKYVRTRCREIEPILQKVLMVHGKRHPELEEISTGFEAVRNEMATHMIKEEQVLFPYITRLAEADRDGRKNARPAFGSVQNPIRVMMAEHDSSGSEMHRIRKLSLDYTPPFDACNSYRVLFKLLEEFENDLHLHVHLENNILFPKAILLEESIAA